MTLVGKKKKKSSVFFNIYWFIILFPAEHPEPPCGLENVTIDNRGEVVGGGEMSILRELSLLCDAVTSYSGNKGKGENVKQRGF